MSLFASSLLSARLHAFSVTSSSSSGHTFLPSALPLAQRLHSVSVGFVTCGRFLYRSTFFFLERSHSRISPRLRSSSSSSSCRFEMKHQFGLWTDPVKRRHMLTSAANKQPGRRRRRVRSRYNPVRTNAGLLSRDDTSQARPGSFFSCFFLVSVFFYRAW